MVVAEPVAPHLLEQLLAGEGAAGLLGQQVEDVELDLRELDVLVRRPSPRGRRVDDEVAEVAHLLLGVVTRGRRRIARTRAASSRGENGLVT